MNNKEKEKYLKLAMGIEEKAKELQKVVENTEFDELVEKITSLRKEIEKEKGLYTGEGIRIE